MKNRNLFLYNLATDIHENHDVVAEHLLPSFN